MRKLFVLLTMSLLVVAASAQKLSWPPKSYPVKVPFTVSEEVKYYWDVHRFVSYLLCVCSVLTPYIIEVSLTE